MTQVFWNKVYDTEKEKKMTELFDSNGEPMFDDLTPMLRKLPSR
jgi:hypothetical protein